MGRRNDHSRDQIRSLALDAARAIVDDDGLGGLSARKVASAIGYTVGSLYNVFANLDDLIMHLNASSLAELNASASDAVDPAADAVTNLQSLARTYVDFAFDNQRRWAAVFEHVPADRAWPAWYRETSSKPVQLIANELARFPGLDDPEINLATRTLFSGVHGACLLAVQGRVELGSRDHVLSVADELISLWVNAHPAE